MAMVTGPMKMGERLRIEIVTNLPKKQAAFSGKWGGRQARGWRRPIGSSMRRVMTSAKPRIVALIVAAGQGNRAGGDRPKQFRMLAGKAVLAHAYDALAAHDGMDAVFIVLGDGQEATARASLGDQRPATFVAG
ncbi:2-C-methyl-D-erythritol 4-phosphate cytidylyltransferase, partial [Sphingobium sp. C100]|uniref:2-C-methyl-D-erythritol 4-phosphate cytidylyltransferase n=1 Tax=Sphingobium sp. C100 TaxID=1207055 RepID=UPI001F1A43B8